MGIDIVGKHLTAYFVLVSGIVAVLPTVLISTDKIPSLSPVHSSFQQVLVSILSILVIAFVVRNKNNLSEEGLSDRPKLSRLVRLAPVVCVVVMIFCIGVYFDLVMNRREATNLVWPIFVFSGIFVMPTAALSMIGIWEYRES